MSATLNIDLTDTCGSRRNFQADRASLDCGAGRLDLQAGCLAYCRTFDDAVLRIIIINPAGEATFVLRNGTASLTATDLHILCEDYREEGAMAGLQG